MKKRKVLKKKKWNKEREYVRNYSFNNPKDEKKINKNIYQEYLRNEQKGIENVSYKYLEEIFTNKVYYEAMKQLPLIEKQALFVVVFESGDIEKACSDMKMTKKEIVEIKTKAINHFKDNVKKQVKKNGGVSNE